MRVVVGVAVVVVAVVLLVVLKNGDDNSGNTTTTSQGKSGTKASIPTIAIKNGEPVGGITDITVNEGERVRFKVDSDVSDEVHVHGYDIMKDVKAGGSVTFDFPATIEGIFEAELESRKEQILELTVNP
jgi:heme/copper-type cytochrome/quinol oxidase subunit 2